MRTALFIITLLLLCGCAAPKVDSRKQKAELPPSPPVVARRSFSAVATTDVATASSVATFAVGEGYTPGPLILDTPHLVSQADTQFPVDVIVDAGCGVVVGRYLNPDPEVYSPITFDGGTDGNAFYLLRARTVNDSILHWTTEFLP